jgi:membrane fusion protein
MSATSDLFRSEAVAHATRRLSGDVVLVAPLSLRLIGFLLAGVVFAAILFASLATYARRANVTGWLVPDQGFIRTTSPAAGLIAHLLVREGDEVEEGQRLAEVRVAAEIAGGNAGAAVAQGLRDEAAATKALPYQRFGVVPGAVKTVSTTVLGPNEISIPGLSIQEPVFRVHVTLSRAAIEAYGKSYPLQPGMLLNADLVFDRRTLLQWLFDPLYAVGQRG